MGCYLPGFFGEPPLTAANREPFPQRPREDMAIGAFTRWIWSWSSLKTYNQSGGILIYYVWKQEGYGDELSQPQLPFCSIIIVEKHI
jgi:hypothetical protein